MLCYVWVTWHNVLRLRFCLKLYEHGLVCRTAPRFWDLGTWNATRFFWGLKLWSIVRVQPFNDSLESGTQERVFQAQNGWGSDVAVMSKYPIPFLSLSTGTGEDRSHSDETDVDIRWRIHLQLVSPEFPLTAGALQSTASPVRDSSISSLLKGVHWWLNTPRWPSQLFYYFRRGGGWVGGRQGDRNTFSVLRLSENPNRPSGFNVQWLCKIFRDVSDSKVEKRDPLIMLLRLPSFQGHSLNTYSSLVLCHLRIISTTYSILSGLSQRVHWNGRNV